MGIFDRFRKRENIIDTNAITDPLLTALIGNTTIDRISALEIPVVSSSVDLICNTFAMIPFKLYKEETKDGKKIKTSAREARSIRKEK